MSIGKKYFVCLMLTLKLAGFASASAFVCDNTPLVIPEPKEMTFAGDFYFRGAFHHHFVKDDILLATEKKPYFQVLLNENLIGLKRIISKEIADFIDVDEKDITSGINENTLITIELQVGREAEVAVPDEDEAYAIKHISISSGSNNHRIILAANDKAGLYWAWQTFKQMIREEGNKIFVSAYNVRDWPDYSIRSVFASTIGTPLLSAEKAVSMKANSVFSPAWRSWGKLRKPEQLKTNIRLLEELCDYLLPRGGDVFFGFNPFDEEESIVISDEKQIQWLFEIFKKGIDLGSRSVIVCIDDPGRRKESFTERDREEYGGDQLLSHAWYIKKMSDKIWKHFPEATIIGATADYMGGKGITGYFDEINVSENLIIAWNGPTCWTFDISKKHIEEFEKSIEGRQFTFTDHALHSYYGRDRGLVTGTEKYGAGKGGPGYKHLYDSKCLGLRINIAPVNQVRLMLLLSAAEYLWNASSYNPEKARHRAAAKVSGSNEAVEPILEFTRKYRNLLEAYPIDYRLPHRSRNEFRTNKDQLRVLGSRVLTEEMSKRYGISDSQYKNLLSTVDEMKMLLAQIEHFSRNSLLVEEYAMMHENMFDIISHLNRKHAPPPLINSQDDFCIDMRLVPGGGIRSYRERNGKIGCAIYGKYTGFNILKPTFRTHSLPEEDVVLKIEGRDSDKNIADIVIEFNGVQIYKGKSPFSRYNWEIAKFKLPAEIFQKGENILVIENTTPESDLMDYWVVINEICFSF